MSSVSSFGDLSAQLSYVLSLPDELLFQILSYLDVSDLLNASRTNHRLRHLCLDPILHIARLARASLTIERSIPCRPTLSELVHHRIYISRTSLAARNLGRNLIKIKLNRSLLHRPSAERLVEQGVLPGECLQSRIAPSLISTKRRIEKEKVKDILRHWIEEWGSKGPRTVKVEERPVVRTLARRFARGVDGASKEGLGQRWGPDKKELPTRAKVLGLRRFWEKIGNEGVKA